MIQTLEACSATSMAADASILLLPKGNLAEATSWLQSVDVLPKECLH